MPWPPGRALLWILNSLHMQCSFPAQVENRLSSSSACSHTHPLQRNPEPGNWELDSIPLGKGRADPASFPCLSMTGCCHQHLLLPTTIFQKKLTRQMLSIPGKPRPPPFGAQDREVPHCSIKWSYVQATQSCQTWAALGWYTGTIIST